jgi:hypothetical protein
MSIQNVTANAHVPCDNGNCLATAASGGVMLEHYTHGFIAHYATWKEALAANPCTMPVGLTPYFPTSPYC